MKIQLDTELGIITVDGVQISLELLKCLANPDPRKLYSMKRNENEVVVMLANPQEIYDIALAQ